MNYESYIDVLNTRIEVANSTKPINKCLYI